jgi:iron(III) transport system substrate-binding protein
MRQHLGGLIALWLIVSACGGAAGASPSSATPKLSEQMTALVAAARSELELSLAWAPGFLDVGPETKRLSDGFNKTYALRLGIATKSTGLSMRESAARVIDEYRRGAKASSDIVLGTEAEISEMSRAGALISEPWQTWMPGFVNLRMIAAGGVGVQIQTRTPGITYNSVRLTGSAIPKSLGDLLRPQYKGRIAITTSTSLFERLAADEVWGAERTLSYVRQLAGQVGGLVNCGDEERIVKGDFDVLVFDCGSARVSQMKAKGTLVGWVEPSDAALLGYLYMGIPKNAVHPNAAKLFMNYMLTREAQDIMYESEFADLHVLGGSKTFIDVDRATKSGVKFYELTTEVVESEANRSGKPVSTVQAQIRDALAPKK